MFVCLFVCFDILETKTKNVLEHALWREGSARKAVRKGMVHFEMLHSLLGLAVRAKLKPTTAFVEGGSYSSAISDQVLFSPH